MPKPKIGNMNGFAVQTVATAVMGFARAAGVRFVSWLLAPHLWLKDEQRGFKVLRYRADGFAPLE